MPRRGVLTSLHVKHGNLMQLERYNWNSDLSQTNSHQATRSRQTTAALHPTAFGLAAPQHAARRPRKDGASRTSPGAKSRNKQPNLGPEIRFLNMKNTLFQVSLKINDERNTQKHSNYSSIASAKSEVQIFPSNAL